MIRAAPPVALRDVKQAVRAAIARIQKAARATEVPPDDLPFQPAAWLVSWPAIAVLWAICGLLFLARVRGWIN